MPAKRCFAFAGKLSDAGKIHIFALIFIA